MRRIFEMVAERRNGVLRSRFPMRICRRTQRRGSDRRQIKGQRALFADAIVVSHGQFTHEIMRVLSVNNGFTVSSLTLLKQLGIPLSGNCRGFKTEHSL